MKYLPLLLLFIFACSAPGEKGQYHVLSKETLKDKIMGAWALQTIGVTYGGPTEFRYLQRTIPDSVEIHWSDSMMYDWMVNRPGLYDDVYMDLTFVEVMEQKGIDAPASAHAEAYANAGYWLWHANQQGRYNILNGIAPPESGHWRNNPHADDIDFQIEADFAGIMNPGLPNSAVDICDRVGHIMNAGDGYYGGVFVAGMYTYAFIEDDIDSIVHHALEMIPGESTFHQCIANVIGWHRVYPDDWRANWRQLEAKWGLDIGCPDGAFRDFNIDAKLNAAYVVLGLLYGEGDLSRTMEIATRAGQDSDCNPATAAAILGTVSGYAAIPDYWSRGLALIEDMDFRYTETSLNDVYAISYRHAMEMIRRHGGKVEGERIFIPVTEAVTVPLEQNFPGYALNEDIPIGLRMDTSTDSEYTFEFSGTGIVVRGKVGNADFEENYALESPEETLDNYVLEVEFRIDDGPGRIMKLPLNFIHRAHELFFQYELPPGSHTLHLVIQNPHEKVYLEVWDAISYRKE